ncbi:hypothetical protein BH09PSE6_BH09PSE6_17910 [soil metagenome]
MSAFNQVLFAYAIFVGTLAVAMASHQPMLAGLLVGPALYFVGKVKP